MTTVGVTVLLLTAAAVVAGADEPAGATWRGLVVAAEDRCSEYVRGDYGDAADEEEIAKNWGGWWSPYDGTEFPNQESDREHIVAVAEAHDSGLCAADVDASRLRSPSLMRARVLLTRFGTKPKASSPGRRAIMREAQEVECFRLAHPALSSVHACEPPELHEAGLVRVEAEPKPGQPFPHVAEVPLRIPLVLEPDHNIVCIADDDRFAFRDTQAPFPVEASSCSTRASQRSIQRAVAAGGGADCHECFTVAANSHELRTRRQRPPADSRRSVLVGSVIARAQRPVPL